MVFYILAGFRRVLDPAYSIDAGVFKFQIMPIQMNVTNANEQVWTASHELSVTLLSWIIRRDPEFATPCLSKRNVFSHR